MARVTMSPVNRGPRVAPWTPQTLDDVRAAAAAGVLTETHYLELKALLPPPSKRVNREAAKDMSALSFDGGVLVYGVAEVGDQCEVCPFPLAGLRERLALIASTSCDPPLLILTRELVEPSSDPALGVLVVEVPASADAPHMVDGRYFARGDTTTHQLGATDVERLVLARAARGIEAGGVVDDEVADDPLGDWAGPGRLYVNAFPLAGPPNLIEDHLETPGFEQSVLRPHPDVGGGSAPNWGYLSGSPEPRAHGLGWRSFGIAGRRVLQHPGEVTPTSKFLDVEIHRSGRVRVWASGLAQDTRNGMVGRDVPTFDHLAAAGLVRGAVEVAAHVSRLSGYGGGWTLVVGIVDIRGRTAASLAWGTRLVPYSEDRYVESRTVAGRDLVENAQRIAAGLTHRLNRGLGVA